MKRTALLAAACAVAAIVPAAATAAPVPSVVYDATPSPVPPNVASLGFQATQTAEFGDQVHLGGTDRVLKTVTVTMSDWAKRSEYPLMPVGGWTHPITLKVYSTHLDPVTGVPDTVLAAVTKTVDIPWRPEADPTCPTVTQWRASDGSCYNGRAFEATFDLSAANATLPADVIVGVAYDTETWGYAPIGAPGPYNSLNVGAPSGQTASVGADVDADAVFWNTKTAGWYADGGLAGVGIFRRDTNWTPNGTVAFRITASAPLVGPPTSKKQCKKGGWRLFNNPSFRNQGQCIRFVVGGHRGQGRDDDREDERGDRGRSSRGSHGSDDLLRAGPRGQPSAISREKTRARTESSSGARRSVKDD